MLSGRKSAAWIFAPLRKEPIAFALLDLQECARFRIATGQLERLEFHLRGIEDRLRNLADRFRAIDIHRLRFIF